MNGNRVKKSHYIPQYKIRKYSDNQKYVFCYDKLKNNTYISSIKDVFCERNIYDIQPKFITDIFGEQFIEKILFAEKIEPRLSELERRIIINEYTSEDLDELASLMYMQAFRTKPIRDTIINYAKLHGLDKDKAKERFIKIMIMEGNKDICKDNFRRMSKTILRSDSDLLLCDRLALTRYKKGKILYPISSNICILLEHSDNKFTLDRYISDDEARNINCSTMNEAMRFVVAKNKEVIHSTLGNICKQITM